MRLTVFICLAAACGACTQRAGIGEGKHTTAFNGPRHDGADAPQYASEAQRNRARNYWLPQNQLPPDATVAAPDLIADAD